MRITPPGDDVVPVPPPLDESPPHDRFCDLVTTGGLASGVVYPWAIVELARAYRFRNIGGTSVGAMAAALAAAAEYGRRTGNDRAFEPLRRLPGALGETLPDRRTRMFSLFQTNARGRRLIELWRRLGRRVLGETLPDGRTRMLSLFQTNPRGRRLLELWRRLGRGRVGDAGEEDPTDEQRAMRRAAGVVWRVVMSVIRAYAKPLAWIALAATAIGVLVWWLIGVHGHGSPWLWAILLLVICLASALVAFACVLWRDIKEGVIDNNLGLCKGGTLEAPGPEGRRPGISEWLHEGIQESAGMKARDRPLTFRDLWCAPLCPGAEGLPCGELDPQERRSINLQMITTNVTHGRPYRLPMLDETSRLFYRPEDLKDYFPLPIIDAMVKVSRPYRAISPSDPEVDPEKTAGFLELPGADMPIVVAARLSLSYPLLFSAVPLWAIDYERKEGQRELKRCLFTDGGVSSNFPIHLFDAALPRWPTFGMWLDRRDPYGPRAEPGSEAPATEPASEAPATEPASEAPATEPASEAPAARSRSADGFPDDPPKEQSELRDDDVWLPELIGEGWSDSWNRFDPFAADSLSGVPRAKPVGVLANLKFSTGFLGGILACAIEWRDRTSFRLPHVRNRVARLWLRKGEGGLNIGMSRKQILQMAHRYGTKTGLAFVERFADSEGQASLSWQEERWMRMVLLVRGLRERLTNLRESLEWTAAGTVPIDEAIERAERSPPLRDGDRSQKLKRSEAEGMRTLLVEIRRMERSLRDLKPEAYKPLPDPELRLRAPL